MNNDETYSPAPWRWIDYGVLADANGEAIADHEDWNVSPANATMIQSAPELYECLQRIRKTYGDKLAGEDSAEIDRVLILATETTK
jgi:hypothetical protein